MNLTILLGLHISTSSADLQMLESNSLILRLEIDRTVQGGGLGLCESWRAVRQVSVQATAVEWVELYLLYGKEGCARVKSKIVFFLGDKLLIIITVEYTLEQRIFLYDE